MYMWNAPIALCIRSTTKPIPYAAHSQERKSRLARLLLRFSNRLLYFSNVFFVCLFVQYDIVTRMFFSMLDPFLWLESRSLIWMWHCVLGLLREQSHVGVIDILRPGFRPFCIPKVYPLDFDSFSWQLSGIKFDF